MSLSYLKRLQLDLAYQVQVYNFIKNEQLDALKLLSLKNKN